jgi:protein-tyrosine-phosphatase/predicted ATP-grasp superfamily ATP-dependent carboligase
MMRLLLLDGDSNAGRAVLQSLGARGHECFLAAASLAHPAFASRYVARALTYPDPLEDKGAFQAWVREAQRAHGFRLVVPATERTFIPLHEVRGDEALGPVLALPPAEAVEVAFDKERTRALAASVGVPSPASLLAHDVADLADRRVDAWLDGSGVVAKGVRSKTWDGPRATEHRAHVVVTRADLERLVATVAPTVPVQVQEWVPGHGVGIELLVDRGEPVLTFAHERVHEMPLTGGGSSYRRSIEAPPALVRASEVLMRALGWHGVAMLEFRIDPERDRFWLMEINGRFWGSLPLAIFAGVDFPAALVDLYTEGRRPAPARYRTGVYARLLERDVDWFKAVARARRDSPHLITRPLGASLVELLRPLAGTEVWDGARLADPGPIVHEVAHVIGRQLGGLGRKTRSAGRERWAAVASRRHLASRAGAERVLVLCHGNLCRSPYVARRLAALVGEPLEVRSAGLAATPGERSPEPFRSLAAARGVDLAAPEARPVTPADLAWADVVVVMDEKNAKLLAALGAGVGDKTVWLGALDPEQPGHAGIEDPFDEPVERVAKILDRLDRATRRLGTALAARRAA